MADQEIEGLPEGATVRALQPEGETALPQPTDASKVEGLPEGSTVRALAPASIDQPATNPPKEAPEGTASKIWHAVNKPLVPEGRAEKEGTAYADAPPTLEESKSPYMTAAKKGIAGAYADTMGFVRGLTSPLGVATLGLGEVGEAPGALGRIGKVGSRMAGVGFGASGAQQAVEGGKDIAAHGVTPENVKQTLSGAGMAAMGGAAGAHGTEVGEQPIQKTLAAPVRAASKIATPLAHIVPSVGGIAAASAAGIPHPFIVGGTLGRFVLPPSYLESIFEKGRTLGLNAEEANITHLQDRYNAAEKAAKQPEKEFKAHQTGREQGIPAPDDVLKAHEKAQKDLQSAKEHLAAAQDDYAAKLSGKAAPTDQAITPEAVEAARPEAPTPTKEQNDAKLSGMMEKIAPTEKPEPAPQNVKTPGQVQPETFPQEPLEAPRATMGKQELARGQGVMGKPRMLTEGAPEAAAAPEVAPEAPKPLLGEILPPERPAKPGRLGTLRVAEGGKVVDTEPELQQKIEEGLQGTPKAVATAPPEAKPEVKEPLTEPIHAKELKNEGKSPEDMSKVEQVVSQHTDQELVRLGKKYGVDEKDYDFSKRDEKRHRVERDDFVNDVLSKMSPEDITNIARLSDEFNKKDTTLWSEAERNALSKAQRSRAIMQEHEGLKSVSGGAPSAAEAPKKYKFGTTQTELDPNSAASKALDTVRSQISDEDLAGDGKNIGTGGNHVTVRYGIKGEDTEGIKDYLSKQPPFKATLGKTEKLPASEHSEGASVIVAPIDSADLSRLNSELEKHGDFSEPSFKEFKPHATIAYVDPSKAEKYVGMNPTEGKSFTVDKVTLRKKDGTTEVVKLSGEPEEEAARRGASAAPEEPPKVSPREEVGQALAGQVGDKENAQYEWVRGMEKRFPSMEREELESLWEKVKPEKPTHEEAVKKGGGVFKGVQEGVPEAGIKSVILFDHPETKSTLGLPEDKVTPEAVKEKLTEHKADWDKKVKPK